MDGMTIGKSALLTDVSMCINRYRLHTPGLFACVQPRLKLADSIDLVPDFIVMVNAGPLKQCTPDYDQGHFVGPPNFIVDIISEHGGHVTDQKMRYEESGVVEYLLIRDGARVSWKWHTLVNGRYRELKPEADGIMRSRALPGLWLDAGALAQRDWWSLMATIDRGITRQDHHKFMASIWPP